MKVETGRWEDARTRLQSAIEQHKEACVELDRANKAFEIATKELSLASSNVDSLNRYSGVEPYSDLLEVIHEMISSIGACSRSRAEHIASQIPDRILWIGRQHGWSDTVFRDELCLWLGL